MSKKSKSDTAENITPMPEPVSAPQTPATLAQLRQAVTKLQAVEIVFEDQKFVIPVRRLTPAEDAQLDAIINVVVPPIIKGKVMEDDRPDITNEDYLKRKSAALIESRALALYWCVPMFSQEKPDLKNTNDIVAFVQSQLNNHILELLWRAVRDNGVSLAQLVNFTSPNASVGS